ncbi:hypothetical protein HMPREF9233_00580 [Actinobaculum massiliense ACS-171-V-Col2]|uniref:Uncharacterized protein n=1 Tax=Actinobaculum massiliense ACS-171-V-Col2 TaxID=883066 RepID=K9EGL7_9ACTO|nr:hypothetical protein HMPREF9233_00580 [Actinobaculum massiliense ACS-171-V-Col2]
MASPLFVYEFVWRVQSCLLQWVQAARKAGLPSPGEGDMSLDNARLRAAGRASEPCGTWHSFERAKSMHDARDCSYGVWKMWQALHRNGIAVS